MTETEKQIDDGGHAFPCEFEANWNEERQEHRRVPLPGMSLRDYLAAKAMQGMTGTLSAEAREAARECDCGYLEAVLVVYEVFSRRAYAIADAMLAARKQ